MSEVIELLKALSTDLSSQRSLEPYIKVVPELLSILGHPDGKIRDELGWATLSQLLRHPDFPAFERKSIANLLLSKSYLFHDIENMDSKAALKRSFSVLTLADVIGGDSDSGATFDSQFVATVSDALGSYLLKEQNSCGHVDSLGWIHCFAHVGDALFQAAMHPNITDEVLAKNTGKILDVVESWRHEVFRWDEEFRLGRPIAASIHRLGVEFVNNNLLQRFSGQFLFESPSRQNFLNTFRAVYLEMQWTHKSSLEKLELVRKIIRCDRA